MDNQFSRGQRVYTTDGRSGIIFSVDNETETCEVYINGQTNSVPINFTELRTHKVPAPNAAEIVLFDQSGVGGNAFSIMGRVTTTAKQLGATSKEQEDYRHDAMSDDYEHLLSVSIKFLQLHGLQ